MYLTALFLTFLRFPELQATSFNWNKSYLFHFFVILRVIYLSCILAFGVYRASDVLLTFFVLFLNFALDLLAFVCWFHRLFDLFVKT